MAEFDRHSAGYRDEVEQSIAFSGQDHEFFLEVKAEALLALTRRHLGPPEALRALDLGCGVGLFDRLLAGRFGSLVGVDPSAEAVERARRNNPGLVFEQYDGRTLEQADGSVDLAFAINVFHHVPPPERDPLLAEMRRVVRPGGLVFIFEHNPFNPLTRRAVDRCPFDADAVLLPRAESHARLAAAGLQPADGGYILFFPWRGRLWRTIEAGLRWLPLGAQYFEVGRTPGAAGGGEGGDR